MNALGLQAQGGRPIKSLFVQAQDAQARQPAFSRAARRKMLGNVAFVVTICFLLSSAIAELHPPAAIISLPSTLKPRIGNSTLQMREFELVPHPLNRLLFARQAGTCQPGFTNCTSAARSCCPTGGECCTASNGLCPLLSDFNLRLIQILIFSRRLLRCWSVLLWKWVLQHW